MNAEERNGYFKELTVILHHEGFTVGPEADGLLPVELDGRRLCLATETGGVRYREEDIADDGGAYTPVGYVKRREAAPELAESGSVRLTLTTAEGEYTLNLPASDERLEQARRILDVENFAQASIHG